jgi:hypothetical protein
VGARQGNVEAMNGRRKGAKNEEMMNMKTR